MLKDAKGHMNKMRKEMEDVTKNEMAFLDMKTVLV